MHVHLARTVTDKWRINGAGPIDADADSHTVVDGRRQERTRLTATAAEHPEKTLELIIHELAHALADSPMEHGSRWGNTGAAAGDTIIRGRLACNPGPKPRVTNAHLDAPAPGDAGGYASAPAPAKA